MVSSVLAAALFVAAASARTLRITHSDVEVSTAELLGFRPGQVIASDADMAAIASAFDPAGAPEPSWLTQGGAVLIQTFGSWTSGYAPLRDIVAANSTLLTAAPLPSSPGQFGGRGCPSGARWIAHNVEAALAPGSGTFYVDDAARAVYYAPAAGDDPADAVMPVLDTLLAIAGDDCGGPVAWTAFEGLNVSYAADGGGRLATGVAPTGAITVAAALHFNLSGVSVQHVGGSGILLLATSRAITIDGCAVRDAGGDGLGAIPGQTDTNVDTVITNTVVEAIGRIYLVQPAGMRIMGSGDQGVTTVAHNHVRGARARARSFVFHLPSLTLSPSPAVAPRRSATRRTPESRWAGTRATRGPQRPRRGGTISAPTSWKTWARACSTTLGAFMCRWAPLDTSARTQTAATSRRSSTPTSCGV